MPSLQSAVETSNVSRTAAEEVLQLELERQAEEIARLSQSLAAAEERLAAVPALQTALTEASRETDELRSTHKAQHIETQREHAAVLAERESLATATVQETAARMSQVLTDASAAQASLTSEMAALQARYTALEAAESAAVAENGRVSAALATRTRELAEKSEAARRVGALLRTAVDEKVGATTALAEQTAAWVSSERWFRWTFVPLLSYAPACRRRHARRFWSGSDRRRSPSAKRSSRVSSSSTRCSWRRPTAAVPRSRTRDCRSRTPRGRSSAARRRRCGRCRARGISR